MIIPSSILSEKLSCAVIACREFDTKYLGDSSE